MDDTSSRLYWWPGEKLLSIRLIYEKYKKLPSKFKYVSGSARKKGDTLNVIYDESGQKHTVMLSHSTSR